MSAYIELDMPYYVGTPRVLEAKCPECSGRATATIQFVATHFNESTHDPAGVWSPAVYECEQGHLTLEDEL